MHFSQTNQCTVITIGKPTMTSAAMQVYSIPELMRFVYEYDGTYHVPYAKCLSEMMLQYEKHAYLRLGRKLLDTYVMKDMEDLGYKFVKVVSCDTDALMEDMYADDDTSSDTTALSAALLETSWYTREVTVMCKYKLPDSDVVRLHEVYLHSVEYSSHDKSLGCSYHILREKPVYREDMDMDTDDEC